VVEAQGHLIDSHLMERIFDTVVEDIVGVDSNSVTAIKLKNINDGSISQLPADGIFIAIGHTPNSALFVATLSCDRQGYITANGVKTSVEGVFAAGDVKDSRYRQAIVAAGDGCIAALEAQWFLQARQLAEPVEGLGLIKSDS